MPFIFEFDSLSSSFTFTECRVYASTFCLQKVDTGLKENEDDRTDDRMIIL